MRSLNQTLKLCSGSSNFALDGDLIMLFLLDKNSWKSTSKSSSHGSNKLFSTKKMLFIAAQLLTIEGVASEELKNGSYGYYLQYAIMASNIYKTEGIYDPNTSVAIASPWLRNKIIESKNQKLINRYLNLSQKEAVDYYDKITDETINDENDDYGTTADDFNGKSIDQSPKSEEDCQQSQTTAPKVDMGFIQKNGWHRVPELHRSINVRKWRVFVPDFAYDVWRKEYEAKPGSNEIKIEYAIVFRGTHGVGGWLSDFRILTALFPIFWDQYKQAKRSAKYIIEQLDGMHKIADETLGTKTDVTFTSVGHSLGGGIAEYIYLTLPRVSKSISFNSSPVNGSRTIVDKNLFNSMYASKNQEIYSISEHSEILTSIAPCHDGAIWGSEGGPVRKCIEINESHGDAFNQHSMPQLACNIHRLHNKEKNIYDKK